MSSSADRWASQGYSNNGMREKKKKFLRLLDLGQCLTGKILLQVDLGQHVI